LQYSVESGSDVQVVDLAESKRPEGLEAVDLGLLHGKLDVTGLFRHVQSLRLEISSHAELSGTRLRLSEQNLRD